MSLFVYHHLSLSLFPVFVGQGASGHRTVFAQVGYYGNA